MDFLEHHSNIKKKMIAGNAKDKSQACVLVTSANKAIKVKHKSNLTATICSKFVLICYIVSREYKKEGRSATVYVLIMQ